MPIRWKMTNDKPESVTVRGWREMLKGAWQAVGQWWDRTVKPRLFDADAADKRGWKPRTERYRRAKIRRAAKDSRIKEGGQRDLILTGQTRTDVMRQQVPKAFPTRVTVQIPTREYVQMRPKAPGRPNLGEELATVTAEEQAEGAQIWQAEFERRWNAYEKRTVRTG